MTVASAYPLSWLSAVARDLSKQLGPGAAAEVVRGDDFRTSASTPAAQPAGSNAVLRPLPEGLSLTLPPLGLRRGSGGYLSFGLLWMGMILFLDVFAYFIVRKNFGLAHYVAINVFLVLFSFVGWAMLAAAIHMARRKATFEVAGGLLKFSTDGPFGKKKHEWSLADILRIHVGPSGRTTNNIPHLALSIHGKGRDPLLALEERDPIEQRWVAGILTAEVDRAKSK